MPDEVLPALSTISVSETKTTSEPALEEPKSEPVSDQQILINEEPQQKLEHDVTIEETKAEPVPVEQKVDMSKEEAPDAVNVVVPVFEELLEAGGEAAANIIEAAHPVTEPETNSELLSQAQGFDEYTESASAAPSDAPSETKSPWDGIFKVWITIILWPIIFVANHRKYSA